jgi:uncharacterized protein
MDFSRDLPADGATRIIRAYAPGSITTNHETVTTSVVIGGATLGPWPPGSPAAIDAAHLAQLLALDPEVVLIGTGARLVQPAPAALAEARARRIGVEVMDTAAACRTYNVLTSEGRRVVAGLLMI